MSRLFFTLKDDSEFRNSSRDNCFTEGIAFGGANVQEDGLFAHVTLSIEIFSESSTLLATIKSEPAGYYRLIVAKNLSQQKFLNGWLNRAYRKIN